VNQVEAGSMLVSQAGETMHEVVQSVRRVTAIMGEITVAGQEQSAGIEQVNRAIAEMDAVTQQNAALVEEATAASQSMRTQAGGLDALVSIFTIEGAGSARPVLPRAAPRRAAPQAQPPALSRAA
jgi:methyl-accepting chemotaxis protein